LSLAALTLGGELCRSPTRAALRRLADENTLRHVRSAAEKYLTKTTSGAMAFRPTTTGRVCPDKLVETYERPSSNDARRKQQSNGDTSTMQSPSTYLVHRLSR